MPQQFDFPGGKSMPTLKLTPKTLAATLGIIAVLWIMSGIYKVAPDERGIVLRFGAFYEESDPGLHYHWPWPIDEVYKPSVTQVYSEEVGFRTTGGTKRGIAKEALMVTGDENIIDVNMVVQYRVTNVRNALFNVEGLGVDLFGSRRVGPGLVHEVCEAVLRQVIGRHTLDNALTEGKEEIQIEIKVQMQQLFDEIYKCGLTVSDVLLQQVVPPREVDAAFKDVISAKEDKERLINEARGYQNEVVPTARGEAEKMIKGAQAYKVERIRRAQGDADRFRSVYAEYKNAPAITEKRLYLETMEKILPRMQKYIIETDKNGGLLNILNLDKKGGVE